MINNTKIITITRDNQLQVWAMGRQYVYKYTSLFLGRFVDWFDGLSGAR